MKKLLITLSLSLFAVIGFAQKSSDIKFDDVKLERVRDEAVLSFTAYTNKCVKRKDLMTLSPRLSYNGKEVEMTKFEIAGKAKANLLRRKAKLTGEKSNLNRYGAKSKILYTYSMPYSEEMVKNPTIKIDRTVENCCKTKNASALNVPVKAGKSMYPVVVEDKVTVVTPKEKNLDIVLDDAVSFKVGKSTLDMSRKNNKESAEKVVAAIKEIMDTKGAKISSITITGFASPEGSESINNRLSNERAVSFMEAIIPQTGLDKWIFKVETGGENWGQLKSIVNSSPSLKNKAKVLTVLDSDLTPVAKQKKMTSLSNYSYIFSKIYPQLRNAGMVKISYTVTE